jgi:hypothetical protein
VLAKPEQCAQRTPDGQVRCRRVVLVAGDLDGAEAIAALEQLVDEPGLADARLADELDDRPPASLPTSGDGLPRSRGCARRAPMAKAANGCALPFSAKGPRGWRSNAVRDRTSVASVARTSPSSALPMMRAAVLIASPLTE